MKLFSRLSAVGAVLVLSTAFASATTYNLGSYASGTNFGNINTPVVYFAGGCTSGGCTGAQAAFNVPPTAPWNASLTATSSWVSSAANTDVGGGVVVPNGHYFFGTAFTLPEPITAFQINLLADDTLTVYIDGIAVPNGLLAQAAPGPNNTCQDLTPNCTQVSTFNAGPLALLILNQAGPHTLVFDVSQIALRAFGFDFTATATSPSAVPEPGTLLLLGTGLIGSAGSLLRRMRATK